MSRKIFIGGNWKMAASVSKVKELVSLLNSATFTDVARDILVAPSFPFLASVKSEIRKEVMVGAQNCCHAPSGAFTGEVSAQMIKDMGIGWVILGHSERRQIFKETDEIISQKVKLALSVGLDVVACIGETRDERNANQTESVLGKQLTALLSSVNNWSHVVIAYEPVWAIGTGDVATPLQAQQSHQFIRSFLAKNVSEAVSSSVRIIYGGSVKGNNCDELIKQPDIDGFLVGGASLSSDFIQISNCKKV